jgi:hypothetical protein
MLTGLSRYEQQAAAIAREVRLLQQEAAPPPTRSAVELAGDLGLALDPWQRDALATPARDILLLASRQAGKSTVSGIMALHQAVYRLGSLVLVVSPSERVRSPLPERYRLSGGDLRQSLQGRRPDLCGQHGLLPLPGVGLPQSGGNVRLRAQLCRGRLGVRQQSGRSPLLRRLYVRRGTMPRRCAAAVRRLWPDLLPDAPLLRQRAL